jgi:hypothetical protein
MYFPYNSGPSDLAINAVVIKDIPRLITEDIVKYTVFFNIVCPLIISFSHFQFDDRKTLHNYSFWALDYIDIRLPDL